MLLHNIISKVFILTIGRILPTDAFSYWYPVSVKGICTIDKKVILLKNERDEWDLPGGKLSYNESFNDCLLREIQEELGISCKVSNLVTTTQVHVKKMINVVVIIFKCDIDAQKSDLIISSEHSEIGHFELEEIMQINIIPQYRDAIIESMAL